MVGIVVGAVSTIFIASPLLSSLLERDPEYAGRRGEAYDEKMRAKVIREAEKAAAGLPAETPDEELDGRRSPAGSQPPTAAAPSPRTPSASGAASGASRGRMDDPGNDLFDERDPLDRILSMLGVEARRAPRRCSTTRRPAGAATRCALGEGTRTAAERRLLRARPDHPRGLGRARPARRPARAPAAADRREARRRREAGRGGSRRAAATVSAWRAIRLSSEIASPFSSSTRSVAGSRPTQTRSSTT